MSASTDPAPLNCFLSSDNTAGIAPEALAAIVAANDGPSFPYGEDPWTKRAAKLVRDIFETDVAVFFVFNGTAANSLALSALASSYHRIICHESAHVETDECGAPGFFSGGAKLVPLPGPNGKLDPMGVERSILQRPDVHHSKVTAISLTESTELGTLYTADEVTALAGLAKKHGLAVHMDGARFANAAAALSSTGVRPADLTWRAGVDVLCLGGTKNGMVSTEAVVFFNPQLASDFAYRVKQGGQLASKQRFASAQWVGMLEQGAWLRHAAHANAIARRLANALRSTPRLRLVTEPEANAVFVEMPVELATALQRAGWHIVPFFGSGTYRLMGSWSATPELIDRFIGSLAACVHTLGWA